MMTATPQDELKAPPCDLLVLLDYWYFHDHPEIQTAWDEFVEQRWKAWAQEHKQWKEAGHAVKRNT